MDTYLDTWPMKPPCSAAWTRASIAGLRSSNRFKTITLLFLNIQSVGRNEFLIWTAG